MKIDLNGSFRNQKVTGQQRYASEIISALIRLKDTCELDLQEIRVHPSRFVILEWFQILLLFLRGRKSAWLLTLTSRGPIWAKNHVLVLHDLFVIEHPEWYSFWYAKSHGTLLKLQLRFAKKVVCVSDPVARKLSQSNLTQAEIIVAPNAPSNVFKADTGTASDAAKTLSKYNLKTQSYILSVGSLDPRKNLTTLVSAYLQLDQDSRTSFPLVVVGGISNVFGPVILPQDPTILRLGYISDNELAIMYKNAKLVVVPSIDEGFGLAAVEAMATGATVLANDIEIFHYVCGDAALYVDCTDQSELLSKLDSVLRSEIRQLAKPIEPVFTWDASASAIVAGLHTIVKA